MGTGARPWRAVTAAATMDAEADGSEWTYLGVFNDNDVAIRLYRRVGFELLDGRRRTCSCPGREGRGPCDRRATDLADAVSRGP